MFELCDKDFDSMELVQGALLLNSTVDSNTCYHWAEQEILRLKTEAADKLASLVDPQERLMALLDLFYQQWGFEGDRETHYASKNAFIEQVLRRKKGVPVSLGSLLLSLAHHVGLELVPIAFPTQLILQTIWDGKKRYINPFDGSWVTEHVLSAWLIGNYGPLFKLKEKHLKPTEHSAIIGRWLGLLKTTLLGEGHFDLALKCTEVALNFSPEDPYEIRDRGMIYQQLDCYQAASMDFQYFIDSCPTDPSIDLLKQQLVVLKEKRSVLH